MGPALLTSAAGSRLVSSIRAWIDPIEITRSAQLYEEQRELAVEPKVAELVRGAPATEVQEPFLAFVRAFLSDFHLSDEQLAVARTVSPGPFEEGWTWLRGLRFDGRISVPSDVSAESPQIGIRLEERAAVIRLLYGPIHFLAETVLQTAAIWARAKDLELHVILEHSSPGPLPTLLDAAVACVFFPRIPEAAVEPKQLQVRERYAAPTIAGPVGALAGRTVNGRAYAAVPSPPLSPDTAAALDASGFVWRPDSAEELSVVDSIEPVRNEVSQYGHTALLPRLTTSTPRNLFVDRYYGLAYDREVIQQTAPYGITELMPDQAVDGMQNSGFLRIPFRKIPRRLVRDRDELLAAVSLATGDTAGLDIVYRGQEREYYLPRQAVVRELLYEDPEAREPSLLPSSARRTVEFEAALVEWCSLVGLYLAEVARLPSDPDVARVLSDYHQQLTSSMKLYLYSLALAQHYGLPSTGLDVTDDLDVAVFFALARFEATEEEGVLRHGRRRSKDPPVLYVFAPPSRFDFEYETVAPIRDFATRPARQRARFLHGGWGLSQNAAARYLRAALYLDPTGDFGEAPSPSILFPAVTEDFCAAWLLSASRALSDSPIKRLLQASLYWVVE